MEYRPLGRTGLLVSALSYGASPLGSVFRIVDQLECTRAVHAALDLGINFIDVSPYYGLTRAEIVLGIALREVPRERYYIATKVGRYGVDDFDFSAERVTRSVDESLWRLGIDSVDLIQCHDIEFGDLDRIIEETIPALRLVCQAGKARFVGITGLPLAALRYVVERVDIDTVLSYCHYSLNDSTLTASLPALEQRGVGIINASPLSMGLLTQRGPAEWHPAPKALRSACATASAWCADQGADIAALALRYSAANPRLATTLVGTASEENIRKNVEWLEQPPDPVLLDGVARILEPVLNMTWPSGRLENS